MHDAKPPATIDCYTTTGEHGCLSNFSRHSILLKGKRLPTTEHYFQARNMRSNRVLVYDGRTMILVEWAEEFGIKPGTLGTRLAKGWSVEEALTRPVKRWRLESRDPSSPRFIHTIAVCLLL